MIRTTLAAITLLSVMTAVAHADDPAADRGLYFQLFGGVNLVPNTDVEVGGVFGGADGDVTADPGPLAGAAVGFHLPLNFRLEGEFSYRTNGFDDIGALKLDGDVDSYTFTTNAFYDFRLTEIGVRSTAVPYIGLGVGYSIVDINDPQIAGAFEFEDDSDGVFMGQVMAGLGMDLSDHWNVRLGYRYFRSLEDVNTDLAENFVLEGHGVEAGIRYSF